MEGLTIIANTRSAFQAISALVWLGDHRPTPTEVGPRSRASSSALRGGSGCARCPGSQVLGREARGRRRSRPAPQGHQGQWAHARRAKSASRGARGGASRLSPQAESLTGRHVVLVLLRGGEVFGVEFLHVAATQGGPSHRTGVAAPNGKALGRDHKDVLGAGAAGAGLHSVCTRAKSVT